MKSHYRCYGVTFILFLLVCLCLSLNSNKLNLAPLNLETFYVLYSFFLWSPVSNARLKHRDTEGHVTRCSHQSRAIDEPTGLKSTDLSLAAPDSTSSSLTHKVTVETKASISKCMDLNLSEVLFYRNVLIIETQWGRTAVTAMTNTEGMQLVHTSVKLEM